jgi:beta-lactamase class D
MLAAETRQGKLYGKTWSGKNAAEKKDPEWFVGFLNSAGIKHDMFACNITGYPYSFFFS